MPSLDPTNQHQPSERHNHNEPPNQILGFRDSILFGSDQLIRQLTREGLLEDSQYKIWSEVHHDAWQAADSTSLTVEKPRLEIFASMIQQLPIPVTIKHALEYERRKQFYEHVSANPENFVREERDAALQLIESISKDKLFPRFRSIESIARLASISLEQVNLKKLEREELFSKTAREAAINSEDSLTIIKRFRSFSPGHGLELLAPEAHLTEFYSQSVYYGFTFDYQFSQSPFAKSEKLKKATKYLSLLAGEVPESRYETLRRFGGGYPIVLDSEKIHYQNEKWIFKSKCFGFRVPYGQDNFHLDRLYEMEELCRFRDIKGGSLELTGRVSPKFLNWLTGELSEGRDPIPSIEIIYVLRLPSGADYRFLLKSSARFDEKHNPPLDSYAIEDQEVIEGLGIHFLDPYNKHSMKILSDFNVPDFPEDLHTYCQSPEKIFDLDIYRRMRKSWDESLIHQLLEGRGHHKTAGATSWMANKDEPYETFLNICNERLDQLPYEQPYREPAFFILSEQERNLFIEEYIPKLFSLCESERIAIESERIGDNHSTRMALSYEGPDAGYGLPLDHMLMDMIIDFRKRFRIDKATSEPYILPVDPKNNRSYDFAESFATLKDLPVILQKLSLDSRFERTNYLIYSDPLSSEGICHYPISKVPYFEKFKADLNYKRCIPFINKFCDEDGVTPINQKDPKIGELYSRILAHMLKRLTNKVSVIDLKLSDLEETRTKRLPKLFSELRQRGLSEEVARAKIKEMKERLTEDRAVWEKRRSLTIDKVLFLCEYFLPVQFKRNAIKFQSIVDSRSIKFAYAIGADGQCRIAKEVPGKKRDQRVTHSQLLGGKRMFGGGELIISEFDRTFNSIESWERFNASHTTNQSAFWYASELNDSTGHYRIWSNTLPYSASVVLPELESLGIPTRNCKIVDKLAPGLKVRGTGTYMF